MRRTYGSNGTTHLLSWAPGTIRTRSQGAQAEDKRERARCLGHARFRGGRRAKLLPGLRDTHDEREQPIVVVVGCRLWERRRSLELGYRLTQRHCR